MVEYGLKTAASHTITVTNTATSLEALIDAADSQTHSLPLDLNVALISIVSGSDIRVLANGLTPTASVGEKLYIGEKKAITAPVKKIKLIRTGASNATVDVKVGWTDPK